jgi:hypothetical protein
VERRKRTRRPPAPSSVSAPGNAAQPLLELPNIDALIHSGGQITLGALDPIDCAAVANDEDQCLAMLRRRPGETLRQLLERLDAAIDLAWTEDKFTDEINSPPR